MKKLTLYTILFFLSTISVAQEAPFITESPGRKLNENKDYLLVQETSNMWDWQESYWKNAWNTTYTYDENNNAYEIWVYSWYESEWFLYNKNFSMFDDNNNLLTMLAKNWNWDISDWENHHKWTYSYDQYNNQVKMLSQTWFEDEGVEYWLNQQKSTYYYYPAESERIVAKHHGLNKAIEDFQTTEHDIIIESARERQSLIGIEVLLDSVLHTSDSDLEFKLSHNDIEVNLIYQAGKDGDNFIGTMLTDGGVDSISTGEAPFPGFYKPENPLSAFLETDPAGTWTLSIYDGVKGNTGILQSWGLNLIYSSGSAVEDVFQNPFEISVFPNPVVDEFRVLSSGFRVSRATLKLFDLNGRKLLEKQIPKGTKEFSVDISHLNSGLYFCRVRTEKGSVTKKLMIRK